MTDVRTPQEIYEQLDINALVSSADSLLHSDPSMLAHVDQMGAAARDLQSLIKGAHADKSMATLEDPAKRLAVTLSVFNAVYRRGTTCEHFLKNPGVVYIALLGAGITGCTDCVRQQSLTASARDDGKCDICDQPTTTFWPLIMQLANIQVMADVCGDCSDFIFV